MSRSPAAGDSTLIRAPNHLGDLVMSLPALAARPDADVLVSRPLAPLLAMTPRTGAVISMDRDEVLRTASAIRQRRYRRAIALPPSFSSAAIHALAGIAHRRGVPSNGRGFLLNDPLPIDPATVHRAELYWWLVVGERAAAPLIPRMPVDDTARAAWLAIAGDHAGGAIGIFPGSNAPSRRWPLARFAELVSVLPPHLKVVVFGGAGERPGARQIAGARALDVAGRTDLATLAAGLASLRVLVTNDSGPMHLAAAVGTPVIALFGAGDPRVTGPLGPAATVIRHPELPCVPCVKNACPRRGPGFILPAAELECMHMVSVEEVHASLRRYLNGS